MRFATRKYFRDIQVLNEHNIPEDKPVILLANHRSAFMDPVIVASHIKRKSHFLARGEQFNNKLLVKFYKAVNMIPIYRKDFTPGETHKNEEIFTYCKALMSEKGCLMIFPEGLCQTKYILAPLKTGAARIALESALEQHKSIYLVPVGINYTNPHRFRGRVTLNIGKAVSTDNFMEEFKRSYWKGVNLLNDQLYRSLKSTIVTVDDEKEIELLCEIEHLIDANSFIIDYGDINWYKRRVLLLKSLRKYQENHPGDFRYFKQKIETYTFKKYYIKDASKGFFKGRIRQNFWLKTVLLFLGLPLFILGVLLHGLPYLLTRYLSIRFVKRIDFMGSFAFALGLLVFLLIGLIQTALTYYLFDAWWLILVFMVLWVPLGVYTFSFTAEMVQWFKDIRWFRWGMFNRKGKLKLKVELKWLVDIINGELLRNA